MARIRLHLPEGEKRSLITVKIDKSFKTVARVSKRTIEVSKAFGLGVDEERVFHVFKDFILEINPGDLVYITGESGSGKSVLLRELARKLSRRKEFGGVITDREVESEIKPNEVLIHGVGRDVMEAMEILNSVGLSDAFLYLRRYKELSDGQRYRYRLAKAFWSGRKTLIFDEFCATLDRITAKVVAYLVQKFCRKRNLTAIVATTHEDLIEDFNPDILIIKRFGPYAEVKLLNPTPRRCSLHRKIRIVEGDLRDYKALSYFHYRGEKVSGVRKVFKAVTDTSLGEELAGVIVYTGSYVHLRGRWEAFPELRELRREDFSEYLKFINENVARIARVVVHPKYRGIGLGVRLVKETMPRCGYPIVETLAVMARYNPFFEKAGMKRFEYESYYHDERQPKFLQELEALGFNPDLLNSRRYCLSVLKNLSKKDREKIVKLLKRYEIVKPKYAKYSLWKKLRAGEFTLEDLAEMISAVKAKPVYLVWVNPDHVERLKRVIPSVSRFTKL